MALAAQQKKFLNVKDDEFDSILNEIHANEEKPEANNHDTINWQEILQEIRVKNINFIKNLITSKEINVNAYNPSDGKTLLIYAVIIGDFDLVTAACNFGADVKIKDNDDLDALDHAIKYGRYKITELVYNRQLSASLGNDLKNISMQIRKKDKEAKFIYDSNEQLSEFIVDFMIKAIEERALFDHTMLYYSWFFVLLKCEKTKKNPFGHKLWKTMMNVYESILSNTSDKAGWKWLKEQFINSLIWYLSHPNNKKDSDDIEEKQEKMETILQTTLFYELLERVRKESKSQSDLLLKEKIDNIKEQKTADWNELISYNVNTKYSSNARQDLCGCLTPKFNKTDLSPDKYPPSTHFSAQKHYDTNIYLNELMFTANILDDKFQKQMKEMTKAIQKETGDEVTYRAGPVKTLSRSQTKVENDYISEDYPTSAKILDINRCALQFTTIEAMMKYIASFTKMINDHKAGCIKGIIRCKNGWSVYNEQYPQYTDIKLNVLVASNKDGKIIAEIQFLLNLMSSFKKKAHKLYGVERKFELVYNYGVFTAQIGQFKDVGDEKKVFRQLALNDDLTFFKQLWEIIEPNISLLVELKTCITIISSPSGNIHTYLQTNCKALYRKSLVFCINNVIKKWSLLINSITENIPNDQNAAKFKFVERLIHLFDDTQKVTDYDDALKTLKSFGIIWDLLDHSVASYVMNDDKTYTLATPNYTFNDYKQTEFKFIDTTFNGGFLYTFGKNDVGQLGLGNTTNKQVPTYCETFNKATILEVASFGEHTLAVSKDGLHAWGHNDKGQLGTATKLKSISNEPYLLPLFSAINQQHKAVHVACGWDHSLVLTENGLVFSFGHGTFGQLGHGATASSTAVNIDEPKLVKGLQGQDIVHITCGNYHNCALSRDGSVFSWGNNEDSELGLGADTDRQIFVPTRIVLNEEYNTEYGLPVYVAGGGYHSLLLTQNGAVYAWGRGQHYSLGRNGKANQSTPKVIEPLLSKRVMSIDCGAYHNFCVTENGEVWNFGYGGFGQLGHGGSGSKYFEPIPKRLDFFADIEVKSCFCGYRDSAVITESGDLYMMGSGNYGELGNDLKKSQLIPTKVKDFKPRSVVSMSLGDQFSVVVTKNKQDGDEKEEDKNQEDIIYLKANEQIEIKDDVREKSFNIFMKNEKLFGGNEWILVAPLVGSDATQM